MTQNNNPDPPLGVDKPLPPPPPPPPVHYMKDGSWKECKRRNEENEKKWYEKCAQYIKDNKKRRSDMDEYDSDTKEDCEITPETRENLESMLEKDFKYHIAVNDESDGMLTYEFDTEMEALIKLKNDLTDYHPGDVCIYYGKKLEIKLSLE